MLVEFSVANFCSFKDAQTLSMMLPQDMKPSKSCFATGFEHIPYLLNLSALYGANGSGKTNLIKAMEFCEKFILESATKKTRGDEIETENFAFDVHTLNEPSEFYFSFLQGDYHFEYGLEVDNHIVHKEYLYAKHKYFKQQIWFERTFQNITIGDMVDGTAEQKNLWRANTAINMSFLSVASQANAEFFFPVFDWFKEKLCIVEQASPSFTVKKSDKSVLFKERVLALLKNLGVAFCDFDIREIKIDKDYFKKLLFEVPSEVQDEMIGRKKHDIYFKYHVNGQDYFLDANKESDGTNSLFAFAGVILYILDNGYIWIADELHRNLHPNAFEAVIELFQNKDINTKNAQLIFSTHDTHPMKFLSRESVWLASKNPDNLQTELSSLSDFRGVPNNLPAHEIIDAYLEGTFGAVPHIRNMNNV